MNRTINGIRVIVLVIALVGVIAAKAQSSGTNSPYSRYGWGTLNDEAMGFNKAMGGVALGMRDPSIINRQNPASYSDMDSLRFLFDIGISLQNCWMREGGTKLNAHNSTLDYASAAFRFAKGLGFSIGLRPLTTIGYDFNATTEMPDIDGLGTKTTTSAYVGSGGLHELYAGVGWQPLKPLSVGANVKYLWGDYDHSSTVTYSETTIQTLARSYKGNLNALGLDLGAQYEYIYGKKDRFIAGITYGLGNKVNQKATFVNQQSSTTTGSNADTTIVRDAFQLPQSIGVGLSWCHAYQWTVGLDYTLQMWKNCRFPALQETNGITSYAVGKNSFQNRHRIAAGVEFIPDPRGMKVRDHICYRAGIAYSTPYAKVNGSSGPKSYLVSAGAAFPIVNRYTSHSVINVAAQWEHMQASSAGSLKEDYLRLCVGITFSARWFEQWKVR